MKKILLIAIALVAAASPALADDKCESIDRLSEAIMQARQQGVPLRKSLSLASGVSIGKTITLDAYKQPRWSGEKARKRAVVDFQNKWYLLCVEHADA